MTNKDIPVLNIDGKEITPATVKMRVWRELLKEADAGEDMADRMDYYMQMIVDVFGRPEVTRDVLDDVLAVEDVIPLYSQCVRYVFGLSVSRLDKLPKNAEAPETAQN